MLVSISQIHHGSQRVNWLVCFEIRDDEILTNGKKDCAREKEGKTENLESASMYKEKKKKNK